MAIRTVMGLSRIACVEDSTATHPLRRGEDHPEGRVVSDDAGESGES
jgi:hypothetical protein